jgi:hypothetical protein
MATSSQQQHPHATTPAHRPVEKASSGALIIASEAAHERSVDKRSSC